MRIALVIITCSLTSTLQVFGQVLFDWENRVENYQFRVKNIEFFIDRFNNQLEGSGRIQTPSPSDSVAIKNFILERDSKIFSLFDLNRLNKRDDKLKQQINTFFLQVNNQYNPRFLNFADKYWFAEVIFVTRYQNQEHTLRCVLQVIIHEHGEYTWTIKSFYSPELQIEERFNGNQLEFPPNVNGTDFMSIRLALNNPSWLKNALQKQENVIYPSLQKLNNGELIIESISQIIYHFLQFEGWGFTVQYVDRELKNSGWLIHKLSEINAQDKTLYLKRYLID